MSLKQLVAHFDDYTNLPIHIEDVKEQIVGLGVQDEILFHFVDIESNKLRGLLYRYIRRQKPYSDPIYCSHICIAKDLSHPWRRVVAAKELLHITDEPDVSAQSEQAVFKLIERAALPFEMQGESNSSRNDKTHLLFALAVLIPRECRKILRRLYNADKITIGEIALMAEVPDRFVPGVLSESFEVISDLADD